MRKEFQGLSPIKEVIAEMSTHLLCKEVTLCVLSGVEGRAPCCVEVETYFEVE